jgi:hypothetical protein
MDDLAVQKIHLMARWIWVNRHQLRILRNQVTSQGLDEFSARYLEMLNHGALSLREGKLEEGFAESRAAVKQADALRYDEPPGWLIPVRHSLGASLMQVGRGAGISR